MGKIIGMLIKLVIFIISMVLITSGQRNIGLQGLGIMILGLIGILGLLFVYNRAHQ